MLQMMPAAHQDIIDECIDQAVAQQQHTNKKMSGDIGGANMSSSSSSTTTVAAVTTIQNNNVGDVAMTKYDFNLSGGGGGVGGISLGGGSLMMHDSDEETESIESGAIDEDPNDPEWCEPPGRL